jgi:exodeoxyribonuclease VII large subunit
VLTTRVGSARAELNARAAALTALGPYATLERGYAIVRGPSGVVLREPAQVRSGDPLAIRLAGGELDARVDKVRDSAR